MPEKSFVISDREVEILAYRLLPEIKKFFANEEIKKEFESGRLNGSTALKKLIR